MCGIAGAFHFERRPAKRPLGKMLDTLRSRGPDESRTITLRDGHLGANRLAIVDVEGGQNPVADTSGRYTVALNGEIYNHRPLRKELEARGAQFQTATDTEVVARLFVEQPARALERLHGMFALAIYDKELRSLTLVRDRLGQKPLYWTLLADGTLLFASELSGILAHPKVERRLHTPALAELLLSEYIAAPQTIYQDIHKLEPGCLLEATAKGIRQRRWWSPPLPGQETDSRSQTSLAEAVWGAFQVSVMNRMEAELPVAYLLSGGLDSSAVCAMAAEKSRSPLKSFSLSFRESSFDESAHAERVAKHLGLDHETLHFGSADLPRVLDHMGQQMSEPLTDGSYPAMWMLSEQIASRGFKIALSGDGADEHFGGYPTYFAHKLAPIAGTAKPLLSRVTQSLPSSTQNLSSTYLARRFVEGSSLPTPRRNQVWLGAFLPKEIDELMREPATPWSAVDRWSSPAAGISDRALQAMFLDQRLYLAEGVLQKVDRASMSHGLEVRSPFLDHLLVELASRLPTRSLWRGRNTKLLVRRMLSDKLPDDILKRPKKGFGTPLGSWLKGPCRNLLEDLDASLESILDPEPIQRWVREHLNGHRDHRRRLWTLLVLSRWLNGPWGLSR
ncbi:MAG: asparagine synthase (glutamine-hydrolyzing) [Myxococcota bacterium]|nr:asparagine synthase (glutamine-hydrolyzing) [Myxococcota bacterium]